MKRFFSLFRRHQSGQAIIFFAIAMPGMLAIMGLAVEGGRLYVQHQQLQSGADMAAMVAAQDLPCTTTDTTCTNKAQSDACAYASLNGFTCVAGAATGPRSNVPPLSCSPYDFLDYGNGSTNAKCKSGTAQLSYDFVEVNLEKNLGIIPIFNVNVKLSVHSVAKRGLVGHNNYVLMALHGGITSTGSCPSTFCPTAILLGSVYAAGPIAGDGADYACGGQWFSAQTISNVWTTGTNNVTYAPLGCGGSAVTCPGGGSGAGTCNGGSTGQALANPNGPVIPDPYAGTSPPPTDAVSSLDATKKMTTCPECSQPGWWVNLDTNPVTWHQGGTPVGTAGQLPQYVGCDSKTGPLYQNINFQRGCSSWKHCDAHAEMFPGIYDTLPNTRDNCIYMNPGVYTFKQSVNPAITTTGDAHQHNAQLCIFGSPSCDYVDSGGNEYSYGNPPTPGYNCDSAHFTDSSDGGNKWEYTCSPWGFWDSSAGIRSVAGAPTAAQLPVTGPTWYDSNAKTWTNVPLNGVVLYFPPNASMTALTTPPGSSSMIMLAAPNPCPGTGSTFTPGGTPVPDAGTLGAVSFPQGNSTATYTYATDSPVTKHGMSAGQKYTNGVGSQISLIYPTNDFTQSGECGLPYVAWPNEMPYPQRVQFLVYETGAMSNNFNGTDDAIFSGLFYAPDASLNFNGKFGQEGAAGSTPGDSGAEGAPWLTGQAVVGSVNLVNAASLQISYLACVAGANQCPGGTGVQLIQ